MRSLLWDRRCSCSLAGLLKAFVQPSNGHRCVLSSEGYLEDVSERGVAGVSSSGPSCSSSSLSSSVSNPDETSEISYSAPVCYIRRRQARPMEASSPGVCFANFEGFLTASLAAFRLTAMFETNFERKQISSQSFRQISLIEVAFDSNRNFLQTLTVLNRA
jgi:hypothetical protein